MTDLGIIGYLSIVVLFVFLALGMPIGFAIILVGFGGMVYVAGFWPALQVLSSSAYYTTYSFTFMVLPLFLLMGYLAESVGIVERLFNALRVIVTGILPGGLIIPAILTAGGFAATTGSSTGSTAIMGVTILPELRKRGYQVRLAAGTIAASGTFASMIPPSGLIVIYAILADISIGQVLMAAIIPGLMTICTYLIYITVRVKLQPTLVPAEIEKFPLSRRLRTVPQLWEITPLITIIVGGMYLGLVTATEAAAMATVAAFLMAMARKRGREQLGASLLKAVGTAGMIATIIVGAMIFMRFIAYTEVISDMSNAIMSVSTNRYVILALIILMYTVLGMFLDALAMVVLTIPLVVPIMESLGFSLVWFGIILVKMVELGLVTPPFGLNVFVLQGVQRDLSLYDIFVGALGFCIPDYVVVVLLIVFPQIALFLPSTMR